jgi:tetratricopeptide (TPR) repeat protein
MAGPDFYIRQIGDSVWMYGEDWSADPTWTSTANGTIIGNTINLNWADVPKGNATLYGTLLLNISTNNELKILNQTGGWGGDKWDQMSLIRSHLVTGVTTNMTNATNPFAKAKGTCGAWCLNQLGRDLNHNHGKYEEAIKAYDEAIKLVPDYADAYYNKGLALRALGRISEADAAFAKANELGYTGQSHL